MHDIADKTRPHLNGGICRQCWGTGMTPDETRALALCRDCLGEGALP